MFLNIKYDIYLEHLWLFVMIEHKGVFIGNKQLRILVWDMGKVFLSLAFPSAIGELFALLMCQIRESVRMFRTYQRLCVRGRYYI